MNIDELNTYCTGELSNIDRVLNELSSVYTPEKSEYTISEHAAIASFIMNVYTGMENILKQMLVFDKLDIEDSPEWHKKVLKKAGEIGILPPDLFKMLAKYLAFRNYFIYSYIFNINWEEMDALGGSIKDITKEFRTEIEEYLQTF